MDWAIVEWGERAVRLDKVNTLDDEEEGADLYALLAARPTRSSWENSRLLYIGKAYRQLVSDRVRQAHASYRKLVEQNRALRPGEDLIIMVGWVDRQRTSLERVTEQFVSDVEALLIYRNQPRLNSRSKDSYGGRRLVVTNTGGYTPLKQSAACCTDHYDSWRASAVGTAMRAYARAAAE